jgi:hypothetical protein
MSATITRLRHPSPGGRIHVRRVADDLIEVMHESASGESFATIGLFDLAERESAVRHALDSIHLYAPCSLGDLNL